MKKIGRYRWKQRTVRLEEGVDTDITIVLPSGECVELQFREEGGTMDVLLPVPCPVHNWEGSDMTPAKPMPRRIRGEYTHHIRTADQLCVEMPDEFHKKEKP